MLQVPLRLRVNAANVNSIISIPSDVSGLFEDTVNTDTVVAGDDVCYQVISGATGTDLGFGIIAITFSPTDSSLAFTKFGNGPFPSFTTASTTRWFTLQGGNTYWYPTETIAIGTTKIQESRETKISRCKGYHQTHELPQLHSPVERTLPLVICLYQ